MELEDRLQSLRRMLRVQNLDAVLMECATNTVPGVSAFTVNGYSPAVGASLEDVAELGVDVPLPPSAIAMEIVSDQAADAAAGTGAQLIEVHGLDANFLEISETKAPAGAAPVALDKNYIRINSIHVMEAGSGDVAAGNILVRAAGAGTTYNKIAAGGNMCLQGHFTVPANKDAYVHEVVMGASTTNVNTIARVLFRAKADWHNRALTEVFLFEKLGVYQKDTQGQHVGHWYPPMCDIKMSAQTVQGAAAAVASGHFDVYLFDRAS